jgi:hypothetical protein
MNLNVPPAEVTIDFGGAGTGMFGVSGSGLGVHGKSTKGVGGLFESQEAAQARLVPAPSGSPEGRVGGGGGELLVTTSPDESGEGVFSLWFCARAGDAANAVCALAAGVRPFPGTDFSEGASGKHLQRLQMQLNTVHSAGLVSDADYGPVTKQAVV